MYQLQIGAEANIPVAFARYTLSFSISYQFVWPGPGPGRSCDIIVRTRQQYILLLWLFTLEKSN